MPVTYAALFRRAMTAPLDLSEDEVAALSPDDRALVAIRCDVEAALVDDVVRRRLGLAPKGGSHQLSAARLKQIVAAARREGFSPVDDIPPEEWVLLCAGGQLSQVVAAMDEGA